MIKDIDSRFLLVNRFDRKIQEQILEELDKIGITLPEDYSQFYYGHQGNMLFLQDYGISIKIEKNNCANSRFRALHPNILQPIAQIRARNVDIDIIPGVDLNIVTHKENDCLISLLKQDNISFYDDGLRNIGTIPAIDEERPNDGTVVIDSLASYDRSLERASTTETKLEYITRVKKVIKHRKNLYKGSPQEKHYRPLKDIFDIALASGKREDFDKAWKACLKFKEEGKLISGWSTLEVNRKEAISGADKHPEIDSISKEYKKMLSNKSTANI